MQYNWRHAALIACLTATACASVDETIDPGGPVSLRGTSYMVVSGAVSPGAIGLFESSYMLALQDARALAEGRESVGASAHARAMAVSGIALADSLCHAFFRQAGQGQRWISFSRDMTALLGSVATAAAGLARTNGATTVGAIGLTTLAATGGLDVYNHNFLFGADNIEHVHQLVSKALALDRQLVLPPSDDARWTFDAAQTVVERHQNICRPANILLLIREAIQKGQVTSNLGMGNGRLSGSERAFIGPNTLISPADRSLSIGIAP